MLLLLTVSIAISIFLHRITMNCYCREYFKDEDTRYPVESSLILAGICLIPAIATFFFVKKFPMLGMVPIAVLVAALVAWIFNQTVKYQIKALCILSIIPASLSVIAKMVLDDKTHSVSIGSIVLNGALPIAICCLASVIRYLYVEGYFMKQRSKEELINEIRNTNEEDKKKLRYKQLISQWNRLGKTAETKRYIAKKTKAFMAGYEAPAKEEKEVEYEDIYSDSSLEPSDTNVDGNKKFYYTVFGIAALIIAVCTAIVLMNL